MRRRREFSADTKAKAALRANGRCESCGMKLRVGGYNFDHDTPDGLGGEPALENCVVLCITCHKLKTKERDMPIMNKADNQRRRITYGIKPKSRPIPGSKGSGIRRRMDGTTYRVEE